MANIVLDCMGGDNSPYAQVKGSILALQSNKDLNLILVGRYRDILFELNKYRFCSDRIEVIDARDVICGDDEPVKSIRSKINSSLVISINELLKREYDAIISTGNSGAFLVGCLFNIGKFNGIHRPALAPIITLGENRFILLDAGANVDCDVNNFVQFGEMGSFYYNILFDKKSPEVCLLNIGVEDTKGNTIVKKAYKEMINHPNINFKGNVEARDIFTKALDVVVCDGFVGNIALKVIEGTSKYILDSSVSNIKNVMFSNFVKNLIRPFVRKMKDRYDYQRYGGAVFLGVKKICIKSHGSSNEIAIKSSIDMAISLIDKNFIGRMKNNYL